jgi:hypothetical protein
MITLQSPGEYEDAAPLINFYIQQGRNQINLDPSEGPFYIASNIELTNGTWLTSNFAFPKIRGIGSERRYRSGEKALLRRHPGRNTMLITNGSNIKVTNLCFDYNFRNGWETFIRPISHATLSGMTQRTVNKVLYEDLDFVDYMYGVREKDVTQDSWSIVLTNNRSDIMTNLTIRRCANKTPGFQLTAGGAGPGINRMLIEDCYCTEGRANSIAISMKYSGGGEAGEGDLSTHQNITIRNNRIWNSPSSGIFIGQDGNEPDKEVNLRNILIENNYVDMRTRGAFARCVLAKTGTDPSSVCENLVVRYNRLDVSRNIAYDPNNFPRWITATAPVGNTLSEIYHYGNQLIGTGGQNTFQNFLVNQNSPPASPLPEPELPLP